MFMHDQSFPPLGRRRVIAGRLARGEAVVSGDLAAEFAVSEDAIRRDLRALARQGACMRVYGGALPSSPASGSIAVRSGEDVARKEALARAALALILPGQTLFLDCGSTPVELARLLPADHGLTVATNSVPAATVLSARPGIALAVVGGSYDAAIGGCVGARSIAEMRRYRIDLCFLGACALSIRHGLSGFDMADVEFKQALVEAAGAAALMATSAKIETSAPFHIAAAAAIGHYVLEHDAPASAVAGLRAAGADVVTAAPPVARASRKPA